jgi:hypothetical protein
MDAKVKAAALGEEPKKKSRKEEMGQKAKRWDEKETMYRQNEDGSTSTHKMASANVDGKSVAFPTVFPKDEKGTASHRPEDWIEPEGWSAYDEAKKRGEVYEFKNDRRANRWAKGKYKKND